MKEISHAVTYMCEDNVFLRNNELALLVLSGGLTTHDAHIEEGMLLLNAETELLLEQNILQHIDS